MKILLALFVFVFLGFFGIYSIAYLNSAAMVTATIKNTDRECKTSDGKIQCRYMVFTDNEVFENTDNLYFWKFNSSDVQNMMDIGSTKTFKVIGWRIPFLSMYRNILEVEND